MIEDRIVGLDEEVLEQFVGLDVDEQGVVGAPDDRCLAQRPPKQSEATVARAVGDQCWRRGVQVWPDERFVGEHAPPRQVDDRLEDHPEALVAKGFLERGRRR